MQKPIFAVAVACLAAGGSVWYTHASQIAQRRRMHQGVLREIALEEAESAAAACEKGVCDLKAVRFRDPASGKVYVPTA